MTQSFSGPPPAGYCARCHQGYAIGPHVCPTWTCAACGMRGRPADADTCANCGARRDHDSKPEPTK